MLVLAGSAVAIFAAEAAIVRDLPAGLHVPEKAMAGPAFDVDRATAAWLGTLSPERRSLSDSYFEGGYWLQLWNLLYGLGVVAALGLCALGAVAYAALGALLGVVKLSELRFVMQRQPGLRSIDPGEQP